MVGPVNGAKAVQEGDVLNADLALREFEGKDKLSVLRTEAQFESLFLMEDCREVPRDVLVVEPLRDAVDARWGRLETYPECGSRPRSGRMDWRRLRLHGRPRGNEALGTLIRVPGL
eukprot:3509666-Alexandrium_andersonii.AAC.2